MKKQKEEEEVTTKKESIEQVMARLQKKYGDDISVVDVDPDVSEVKVIPSGSYGLDSVFGCGGIPKGRMIELFGQESSGKTTLAHFLIAQVQKAGGKAGLIDAEFSYDPRYTSSIGVDTAKLLVTQPLHLEAAMGTLRELVETNQFDIIVLDSIAAMAPKSEIEDEFLKDTMALQARKLGAALRILAGSVSRSKTIVIFINQLRDKVGVFYGAKTVTPGGKALKFFSSVRLEVSKGEKIVDADDKQIGNFLNITGVKTKLNESQAIVNNNFASFTINDNIKSFIEKLPPLFTYFGNYNLSPNSNILFHQKIGSVNTDDPLIMFTQSPNSKVGVVAGEG